jgi:hypothetical protein
MSDHTPTPWRVEEYEDRKGNERARIVSAAFSDEEPGICGDHSKAWPLTDEDAAFIVLACNAHDRLAAIWRAAEVLVASLTVNGAAALRQDHACRVCTPGGGIVRRGFLCAFHRLAAALSKAEG